MCLDVAAVKMLGTFLDTDVLFSYSSWSGNWSEAHILNFTELEKFFKIYKSDHKTTDSDSY